MNPKRIGGLAAIIIGVVLILFGLHAKNRVLEIRASINKTSGFFSDNPVNKEIDKALEHKIGEYDGPILMSLVGGGILIIAGIAIMVFCNKKHRR